VYQKNVKYYVYQKNMKYYVYQKNVKYYVYQKNMKYYVYQKNMKYYVYQKNMKYYVYQKNVKYYVYQKNVKYYVYQKNMKYYVYQLNQQKTPNNITKMFTCFTRSNAVYNLHCESKRGELYSCPERCQILTHIQNSFTSRPSSKLSDHWSRKYPPHLECVTTLPYEILIQKTTTIHNKYRWQSPPFYPMLHFTLHYIT